MRLLSVRHEFPTEWARFTPPRSAPDPPAAAVAPLPLTLRQEHYPFWSTVFEPIELARVELYAQPGPATPSTVIVFDKETDDPPGTRVADPLVEDPSLGGLRIGALERPGRRGGELTRFLDDNSMSDLWLALTWGGSP